MSAAEIVALALAGVALLFLFAWLVGWVLRTAGQAELEAPPGYATAESLARERAEVLGRHVDDPQPSEFEAASERTWPGDDS